MGLVSKVTEPSDTSENWQFSAPFYPIHVNILNSCCSFVDMKMDESYIRFRYLTPFVYSGNNPLQTPENRSHLR